MNFKRVFIFIVLITALRAPLAQASMASKITDFAVKFKLFQKAPLFSIRGRIAQQSTLFKSVRTKLEIVQKESMNKETVVQALQLKDTQKISEYINERPLWTYSSVVRREYELISQPHKTIGAIMEAIEAEKALKARFNIKA